MKGTVKGMIFAQRLRNQALDAQDPETRKLQLEVEQYKKVRPAFRLRSSAPRPAVRRADSFVCSSPLQAAEEEDPSQVLQTGQ